MTKTVFSLIPLTDLAVINLTGADATTFLQSQLTQDVTALGADRASLAGYCSARGRLMATMIAVQQGADQSDGWMLVSKADNAMAFAQRLRMFVLRAKVDITVSEIGPVGVRHIPSGSNTGPTNMLTRDGQPLALPDAAAPYTVTRQDGLIWIQTPDHQQASGTRWWLLNAPATELQTSDTELQAWQADDIAAGLPWVQAATNEAFIPQTLNMDLTDGVSFTKGCYPGQEVVARSHYRGTIKRRMAYAKGETTAVDAVHELIGADTFDANKPGRACGRIINAAVAHDALHVLMEVQLADLGEADFRAAADDGPALTVHPLPYDIHAQKE